MYKFNQLLMTNTQEEEEHLQMILRTQAKLKLIPSNFPVCLEDLEEMYPNEL